jgi:hypothetical protein
MNLVVWKRQGRWWVQRRDSEQHPWSQPEGPYPTREAALRRSGIVARWLDSEGHIERVG